MAKNIFSPKSIMTRKVSMRKLIAIALFMPVLCIAKPEDKPKTIDIPCGKVAVVRFASDMIEVVLTPVGGKHNRGEEFKKSDFDLTLVSQSALRALESKTLLFCVQMNKDNKVEYWITK